jgi:hypothetical protein
VSRLSISIIEDRVRSTAVKRERPEARVRTALIAVNVYFDVSTGQPVEAVTAVGDGDGRQRVYTCANRTLTEEVREADRSVGANTAQPVSSS